MKVEENTKKISSENDKHLKPQISNLKIDLNIIKENEENIEKNDLDDEEESLRYDSLYKPALTDYKKSLNTSTTVSLNENGFDSFSPKKSNPDFSSQVSIGRERFYSSSISNYFEGTDNYFRGLNPEKNDYQKSNNYLKKKEFFRDHFLSFDLLNSNEENNFSQTLSSEINSNNLIKPQPHSSRSDLNENFGKFDYPMDNFGYFNADCKSKSFI